MRGVSTAHLLLPRLCSVWLTLPSSVDQFHRGPLVSASGSFSFPCLYYPTLTQVISTPTTHRRKQSTTLFQLLTLFALVKMVFYIFSTIRAKIWSRSPIELLKEVRRLSAPTIPQEQHNERHGATPVVDHLSAKEFSLLTTELVALLESASTPNEFFSVYLNRILRLTGGVGGVVWKRDSHGHFKREQDFNTNALQLDNIANGWAMHDLLLEDTALRGRAVWTLPHNLVEKEKATLRANLSPLILLTAPILIEKKTVGILEIFFEKDPDRQVKRHLSRLATELTGFAAAFYHRIQWRQMQDNQEFFHQLEGFAASIHKSLKSDEIACVTANDGKHILECDQLSVGLGLGNSIRVSAISGSMMVEKRSPLVRAMTTLQTQVADWGETLVYQGNQDETLPPKVAGALDEYLSLSGCNLLIAMPLINDVEGPKKSETVGVLLAEQFDGTRTPEQIKKRLKPMSRHVTPALHNALLHEQMPLKWLSNFVAAVQDHLHGRGLVKAGVCMAVLVIISCLLIFIQAPLRSEATGHLAPKERRIVYSPIEGKILQLTAQHGDRVEKGQELLFIEDLDAQLKLDQLTVKIGSFNEKLGFIDEQLGRNLSPKDKSDYLNERIQVHYELQKARVERNLLLAEIRTPRKSPISAPLSGKVITFDAKEKLVGKTVKVGDPLIRIAETSGPWEVQLFIPEREVGKLRNALVRADSGKAVVDLLLTSDPNRTYKGEIGLAELGGETVTREGTVVLPARVRLTDRDLITQLERTPVGVEVRARINCGYASIGYVWFSEIWDFLYERFIF